MSNEDASSDNSAAEALSDDSAAEALSDDSAVAEAMAASQQRDADGCRGHSVLGCA